MSEFNFMNGMRFGKSYMAQLAKYQQQINLLTEKVRKDQEDMGKDKLPFVNLLKEKSMSNDWMRYIASSTPTYGPLFSERKEKEMTTEEKIKKLEAELAEAKKKHEEENKPEPITEVNAMIEKLGSGYLLKDSYCCRAADKKAFSTKAELIKEVTRMIEGME